MSSLNLTSLRGQLSTQTGVEYWRSLEQLADTPEFRAFVEDEFPSRAEQLADGGQSRRDMLRMMAAVFGVAGLTGCVRQPQERILPYVRQPEEIVPGKPLYFATSMPFRGSAVGLVVRSYEGRPVKVEGNELHPASLGRTLPLHQTSTLDLYDPDRSRTAMYRGRISGWGQFLNAMAEVRDSIGDGTGLHVLSEVWQSPSLLAQRDGLKSRYPQMQWHEYDAIGQDSVRQGSRIAFGTQVNTVYRFDRADVILSLDADFLYAMPGSIAYARQFVSRRNGSADRQKMNRLYVVEPSPSITGDKADHRFPMRAADVEPFARAVASYVGAGGSTPNLSGNFNSIAQAIARDLQAHKGAGIVVAGEQQPASVHALAHAINAALGNVGTTVLYTDTSDPNAADQIASLRTLTDAMRSRQVKVLLILSANPVYSAPADLRFAEAAAQVPLLIHLGSHYDETGHQCHWHIPEAHYLEAWGDATAYDGTVSIIQPLIQPLYESKTAQQVLATLTDNPEQSSYDLVREFWRAQVGNAEFEDFWQRSLHDGILANTAFPIRASTAAASVPPPSTPAPSGQGLEIVFRPDPMVWDGRFANNGWLQECPKPHTKLTWENAVHVSPGTAKRLNLVSEDLVEIQYRGRSIRGPVWITPGQADESIAVHLGYGRTQSGHVGDGAGFNAYLIRTSDALHFGSGAELRKIGGKHHLACTQDHGSMEGRDIVRSGANQQFLQNPKLFQTPEKEAAQVTFSLYPEWKYEGYAWGMVIDHNACIGCSACVVACEAENNIPVVGKAQVRVGREMHWIRIDRYFSGSPENPRTHFQPMLCQHCEKAPCELVCPVAATVHNGDGLSQMIYNRCIGTRYCSNNCPYKVRRFNFLLYADWDTPSLEPLRNPDVTVRSRGVMEKCSFCIQRISAGKIESEKENRRIRDGEVVTACAMACPTDAIVFGDLNDRESQVFRLKNNPLAYSVLSELGVQPRIRYLAELRNINPELEQRS